MLETLGEANTAALFGLLGGIIIGLASRLGRFCTLGAIEDCLYSTDQRRIRMWGVAIGVAVIGTHTAMILGWLDPAQIGALTRGWNPLATVLGGLMFGYGMALCGNCGSGALARLGGGDLRSLVIVLVTGISAYFVMSGPLAQTRVMLFPTYPTELPTGFAHWFGNAATIAGILIGIFITAFALANKAMIKSTNEVFWGAAVGVAIVTGWLATHWIATTGFGADPVQSHTFAAPIGDTLIYIMTASGTPISFGVGSIFGVVLGAFIGALFKKQFRWEACDDPRELGRQIAGAALMGVGAVLAVGCSIGQGISAFSMLTYSAPVTLLMIFIGAAIGLRQLITGFGRQV